MFVLKKIIRNKKNFKFCISWDNEERDEERVAARQHCPKIIVSINIAVNIYGCCPLWRWHHASRESFTAIRAPKLRREKRNECGRRKLVWTYTNKLHTFMLAKRCSENQATARKREQSGRIFVRRSSFANEFEIRDRLQ